MYRPAGDKKAFSHFDANCIAGECLPKDLDDLIKANSGEWPQTAQCTHTIQCNAILYNAIQCTHTMQCNAYYTMQYYTIQYYTTQYPTMHYYTMQYYTMQYYIMRYYITHVL